jgi:glycosyltransferase involved in cell wall biosynthesis
MKKALSILMIVFNQEGKGTYWRAFHWARMLVRRGHEVTLLATSLRSKFFFSEKQQDGVRVVETPDLFSGSLRSGWDPWNTLKRIFWLKGRAFDIVHAFEARPVVIYPALQARKRGARLIIDWCDWFGRGGSVEERSNSLMRTLLRPVETHYEEAFRMGADGQTIINTFLRTKAINLGESPDKILLIRNGSDPQINPRPKMELRQALGLPGDIYLIGFVGGTYLQDARFMAEAFNEILPRLENIQLVLVGYFNRDIEKMVSRASAIIRTGSLPYALLFDYLAACDICWLPLCDTGANRGRWPLKFNDYLTVGRPVMATDVGDLREVIRENQVGLTSENNPFDFAQKSLDLMLNVPLRETMGRQARQAAETVFSWEKMTLDLESFYFEILSSQKNNQ